MGRLWVDEEEASGGQKAEPQSMSVLGLSVRARLLRAGGWSQARLGSMFSAVHASAKFLFAPISH